MSLLSSSPSLQTVRSVLGDEVFLMFPVKSQAHESSLFYPLLMIHRLGFVGGFLDVEEVLLTLMLDGTYLSRNFATLGPSSLTAAVWFVWIGGCK